jgi:hypothetical protein
MLWAQQYYWPGNATSPCFRWPALTCDGNPHDPNGGNFYNGTNPRLKPGALLAVPPSLSQALAPSLRTEVARKILAALTDYGGYLDVRFNSEFFGALTCFVDSRFSKTVFDWGGGGGVVLFGGFLFFALDGTSIQLQGV